MKKFTWFTFLALAVIVTASYKACGLILYDRCFASGHDHLACKAYGESLGFVKVGRLRNSQEVAE